jgi:gamma-butyrobetaine dioxygenase
MPITAIHSRARTVAIEWTDGSISEFPYLFLLDNDPSRFHPQTGERELDLLRIPGGIEAKSVALKGADLVIDWASDVVVPTRIPVNWLDEHRPGSRWRDPADVPAKTWGSGFELELPRGEVSALAADGRAFLDWLFETKRHGLSLVTGLADDEEVGVRLGERIGFLRRTNFGLTFRVETKPDPNNLAYTAHALPLHTDLPNQELPPGYQFLHAIRNEAVGGESTFADGFRIAESLRERDPDAFDLLTRIPVPYRFHDREFDIRVHRPVIGLDERGQIFDIRYSAHLMDAFDMPAAVMDDYYRAYRLFMRETRNPAHGIRFKLRAGEMVVFDNRRVLHGRTAFDPTTGHRLLKGFYIDRGEFDSCVRRCATTVGVTDAD